MKFIALILSTLFGFVALGQVPAPGSPTGGALGQAGTFPFRNGGSIQMTSDADYTLNYPQTSAGFIKFTSSVALTATRNINGFPTCNAANTNFEIGAENATSGGQAINLAGVITIANGQWGRATCDGSSYISTGGGSSTNTVNTYNVSMFPSSCTVNSVAYTTQADCAFYSALLASNTTGTGSQIILPPGTWNTCAGWYWNTPYTFGAKLSIQGAGAVNTNLNLICSNATAALYTTLLQSDMSITGLTVNAEYLAPAAIQLVGVFNLKMSHVYVRGAAFGGNCELCLVGSTGLSSGTGGEEQVLDDIQAIGYQPNGVAPNITVNLTGGAISGFTIVNGGTNYSSTITPYVYYLGTQGGTATQPCTTMPTNQPIVTITGGVITNVALVDGTTASTGAGCVGPVYFYAYDGDTIPYGVSLYVSDSTFKDLIASTGYLAGIRILESSNTFIHAHPFDIPVGVLEPNNTSNTYLGSEMDSDSVAGFQFGQTSRGSNIIGTQWYYDTKQTYYGATGYQVQSSNSTNVMSDGSCGISANAGYYQFMGPTAPATPGNVFSYPGNVSLRGEQDCLSLKKVWQAPGAASWVYGYTPAGSRLSDTQVLYWYGANADLSVFSHTGTTPPYWEYYAGRASAGIFQLGLSANATASSGTNYTSPIFYLKGFCWNGSSSVADFWSWQNTLGGGTNPISSMVYTHSGCGAASFAVPALSVRGTRTITANDTGTASDYQISCNSTSGISETLGTPVAGQVLSIKNINTGTCTVTPGASTLDGGAITSLALTTQNSSVMLYYNATQSTWQVLSSYSGSGSTAGGVASVFGRTGVVTAATGDYTVSQVTGAAPIASPTFTGAVTTPITYQSNVAFVSGNYTATATSSFLECQTGGITITLPSAPATGQTITVKNTSSGSCAILPATGSIDQLYAPIVLNAPAGVATSVSLFWDQYHWYIVGGQNFSQPGLFVMYSTSTLSNTTTTISLISTGYGTMTQPAYFWVNGRVAKLHMGGVFNTAATPGNFTFNVNYGGSTITTATVSNLPASASTLRVAVDLVITCRLITTNTCAAFIDGEATYSLGNGTYGTVDLSNAGNGFNITTNSANLWDVTGAWATASASNVMKMTTAVLQQTN